MIKSRAYDATPGKVDLGELDKLAKLLAAENISVEHAKVPTAFFDVKSRRLVLPMWKDLTLELYHMLVLHEVSHALHTDPQKWESECKADPDLTPYLNIVEDARIERLMKDKFPGSRRDFRIGYQILNDRDFFQLATRDIYSMSLPDRLNLHYKIGHMVYVPFRSAERKFINLIDATRSFDEVVVVAKLLQEYHTKKQEQPEEEKKQGQGRATNKSGNKAGEQANHGKGDPNACANNEGPPEEGHGQEVSDDDGQSRDIDYTAQHEESKVNNDPAGEGEDAEGTGEDEPEGDDEEFKDAAAEGVEESEEVTTVDSLAAGISSMNDAKAKEIQYFDLDVKVPYQDYIITYKDILNAGLAYARGNNLMLDGSNFINMRRKNIKTIDYLVKQFETLKAADRYSRQKESKTGVINPTKLHSYKLVEDIFKRNTTCPDSKNHGIMMFIDFSGSMGGNMPATIEQLFNLTMFCKKVNIPFRVYAFTDSVSRANLANKRSTNYYYQNNNSANQTRNQGILQRGAATGFKTMLTPNNNMNLLELFSEKMTAPEFRDMIEMLIRKFSRKGSSFDFGAFDLGGTPLDGAILLARPMLREFKKETKTQLVSAVFLTDGESTGVHAYCHDDRSRPARIGQLNYANDGSIVRDTWTKKTYKSTRARQTFTDMLLQMISSDGFNVVGYRVGFDTELVHFATTLSHEGYDVARLRSELKSNNCGTMINCHGFEQLHLLIYGQGHSYSYNTGAPTGDIEDDDDFGFEIAAGSSKKAMTKAFIQAKESRMNTKVILRKFIEKVAA